MRKIKFMRFLEAFPGIKLFAPEFFSSNVYLIDNELLIDTGTGKFGEMLTKKLQELRTNPKLLVLTHCHWDHVGGAEFLRKNFNLEILMHEKDAEVIEKSPLYTFAHFFNEEFEFFTVNRKLKGDEKITTENFCFRVLHTPGHTQGSICLYEKEKEILISGDTFFGNAVGRTDLPGGDEKALKNSLRKLSELEINLLLPGHGKPKKGNIGRVIKEFI